MSTPIPSFRHLSISPIMQSSRSQTAGSVGRGHGKGKAKPVPREEDLTDSDKESQNEEPEDNFAENDPPEDSQNEDPSEADQLFALDHCRQHGHRYAFQLAYAPVKRYGIRIHKSEASECSCNKENCRHYLWLLEEIARAREGSSISPPVSPHDQISSIGLKTICEELHWEMREGYEDTETKWLLKKDYSVQAIRRQTRNVTRERIRVVRDIMATLSPSVPEDYRTDIFDTLDKLPESPLVIGDLERTLILLLIKNDDIYYQFKDLVSRNVRASEFYRKMALKAQNTCSSLDYYCEFGAAAGQQPHDLVWCAQSLVDIVQSISASFDERQPLRSQSRSEAAETLILILKTVVRYRNYDVYQNSTIVRRVPHGEQLADRNLYERLIGCGTSPKNPSGGNFILEVLQYLPEARLYIEDLEDLLEILGTIGWGPAPRAYRNKLERIIAQLKGETGPSLGLNSNVIEEGDETSARPSSSKRHGGSMDRKAKRMK